MIDFHNHILPQIDDGSKSLEMSINMLRVAESQGIRDVVNTVHFQHPKMDGKNITFDIISKELEKLQRALDEEGINIKIHIGSEVFFLPNLVELKQNPLCTMGNGKYMLIEFPIFQFPKNYEKELFNLHLSGITPIIAHPERYREIENNMNIMESFFDKGYIIQLDAGSILGHFGASVQKCVYDIMERGWFHLIGSDAHNNYKRNFCIKEVIDMELDIIRENENIIFIKNPHNILNGEEVFELVIEKKHNEYERILQKINSFFNFNKQ